eukprot:scaffold2859_cov349-Pavlova_lutheri.AAC.84
MDYGGSAAVNIGSNAAMPESKGTSSTGWSSIFFRVLQLLFSMIAFALVASADKFEHAALGYLVAAGVIAFVYALLQIVMEFIGSPSVQFDVGFEFLVNVFLLSSASAAAAAREEVTGMSSGEEGRVIGVSFSIKRQSRVLPYAC